MAIIPEDVRAKRIEKDQCVYCGYPNLYELRGGERKKLQCPNCQKARHTIYTFTTFN